MLGVGLAAAGIVGLGSDDDENEPDDGMPEEEPIDPEFTILEPEEEEIDPGFIILNETQVVGTDADDTLLLGDLSEDAKDLEISGGDGDDVIDLRDPESNLGLYGAPVVAESIDGGAGNDTIYGHLDGGEVRGGDGDDTINVHSDGRVEGGDGNDYITVSQSGSDMIVEGGAGDDVIVGHIDSGQLNGGAGNDTISASAQGSFEGTGYVVVPDGGEGDDVIKFRVKSDFSSPGSEQQLAKGGEGADRFEVFLNEGREGDLDYADPIQNDFLTQVDADTWRLETLNLVDFEVGEDKLVIKAETQVDGYALNSVRMEEVDDSQGIPQSTDVILSYEHDTEETREVVVSLHATDVEWDDIEVLYEGAPFPTLIG